MRLWWQVKNELRFYELAQSDKRQNNHSFRLRGKKTGRRLYHVIKRNPFSNKMQERTPCKARISQNLCGRSQKIDPASCILLGSRLSPLLSRSLFAVGDVETSHEEPPVRDYEIALPPSRGVFNLIYYRFSLSLSLHAQGTNFTIIFFAGDLSFSEAREIRRKQAFILIRCELFVETRSIRRICENNEV